MWYLAPGSKSSSVLSTGGEIPWYLHLNKKNIRKLYGSIITFNSYNRWIYRRYMAEILPIRRKTLYNQSIIQSINGFLFTLDWWVFFLEFSLHVSVHTHISVFQNATKHDKIKLKIKKFQNELEIISKE